MHETVDYLGSWFLERDAAFSPVNSTRQKSLQLKLGCTDANTGSDIGPILTRIAGWDIGDNGADLSYIKFFNINFLLF